MGSEEMVMLRWMCDVRKLEKMFKKGLKLYGHVMRMDYVEGNRSTQNRALCRGSWSERCMWEKIRLKKKISVKNISA